MIFVHNALLLVLTHTVFAFLYKLYLKPARQTCKKCDMLSVNF